MTLGPKLFGLVRVYCTCIFLFIPAACEFGEVIVTATGAVSAFCFNGELYFVPARLDVLVLVFGSLFGVTLLALIVVSVVFVIFVVRSRKKSSKKGRTVRE
jgi:hypothetical protein